MNVRPASIEPRILTREHEGKALFFLICGKRLGYMKPPLGSPREIIGISPIAPIAIKIIPADGYAPHPGWFSGDETIDLPMASVAVETKVGFHGENWRCFGLEAIDRTRELEPGDVLVRAA